MDATAGSRRSESLGRSLIAGKTPDVSDANVQRSRGAWPANDEQGLLESGRDIEVERGRGAPAALERGGSGRFLVKPHGESRSEDRCPVGAPQPSWATAVRSSGSKGRS